MRAAQSSHDGSMSKSASQIIDEVRQRLGVENDTELARKLRLNKSTISSWRSRESVPERYLRILDGEGLEPLAVKPSGWGDYERYAFRLALFRFCRLQSELVAQNDYRDLVDTFKHDAGFWALVEQARKDIAEQDGNLPHNPGTAFALCVYDDLEDTNGTIKRDRAVFDLVRIRGSPKR